MQVYPDRDLARKLSRELEESFGGMDSDLPSNLTRAFPEVLTPKLVRYVRDLPKSVNYGEMSLFYDIVYRFNVTIPSGHFDILTVPRNPINAKMYDRLKGFSPLIPLQIRSDVPVHKGYVTDVSQARVQVVGKKYERVKVNGVEFQSKDISFLLPDTPLDIFSEYSDDFTLSALTLKDTRLLREYFKGRIMMIQLYLGLSTNAFKTLTGSDNYLTKYGVNLHQRALIDLKFSLGEVPT